MGECFSFPRYCNLYLGPEEFSGNGPFDAPRPVNAPPSIATPGGTSLQ